MASSGHSGPINLGNPHEISMLDLAHWIVRLVGSDSPVVHIGRPVDDPTVRRPDTTLAEQELGWRPEVPIEEALLRTITWFRKHDGEVPPLSPAAIEEILATGRSARSAV